MSRRAGELRAPLAEAGNKSPTPGASEEGTKRGKCPVTPLDTFTSRSRVSFPEPKGRLTRNTRGVGASPNLGSILRQPTDLKAQGALPNHFAEPFLTWPH